MVLAARNILSQSLIEYARDAVYALMSIPAATPHEHRHADAARPRDGQSGSGGGIFSAGPGALKLLPKSQPNLLVTCSAIWGCLIVLRAMGAAVPRFSGFGMFRFWLKSLSFKEKLSSFLGTAKRVYAKKLTRPCNVGDWAPEQRRE